MLFRIFLKGTNKKINVKSEDFRYLTKVLRLKNNDQFETTDGTTSLNIYKIIKIEKNSLTAELERSYQENNEPTRKLTLVQGLPKADKLEYILQKCTEIGVKEFIIYQADLSPVKLKNTPNKLARWQKIVESAVCQSRRNHLPEIKLCENLSKALGNSNSKQIFSCISNIENNKKNFLPFGEGGPLAVDGVAICIGPEAGFSDKEINLLKEKTSPISLGKRTLRTETAAVAATAKILL